MCEWLMESTNSASTLLQGHVLLVGFVVVCFVVLFFWASAWGDDEEDMKE